MRVFRVDLGSLSGRHWGISQASIADSSLATLAAGVPLVSASLLSPAHKLRRSRRCRAESTSDDHDDDD